MYEAQLSPFYVCPFIQYYRECEGKTVLEWIIKSTTRTVTLTRHLLFQTHVHPIQNDSRMCICRIELKPNVSCQNFHVALKEF